VIRYLATILYSAFILVSGVPGAHADSSPETILHSAFASISGVFAKRADPSFDCSKAKHPDEQAICADADLARRDQTDNQAFVELRRRPELANKLREAGRKFIAARHACGSNVDCIRQTQDAVLVAVTQIAGSTSNSAGKPLNIMPTAAVKGIHVPTPEGQPTDKEKPRSIDLVTTGTVAKPVAASGNHGATQVLGAPPRDIAALESPASLVSPFAAPVSPSYSLAPQAVQIAQTTSEPNQTARDLSSSIHASPDGDNKVTPGASASPSGFEPLKTLLPTYSGVFLICAALGFSRRWRWALAVCAASSFILMIEGKIVFHHSSNYFTYLVLALIFGMSAFSLVVVISLASRIARRELWKERLWKGVEDDASVAFPTATEPISADAQYPALDLQQSEAA
jgi:uncharacterized protein